MNLEISAAELAEFVKQLTSDQGEQKSVPVAQKVQNSPTAPKATPVPTKMEKELQKKIEKLTARVESLEIVLYESKQLLTTEDAAILLGMSRSSIYKMTHEGVIPFYKPNGKVVYFEKEELLKWMRPCRVASEKEIEEAAKLKIQELVMKSLKRKN